MQQLLITSEAIILGIFLVFLGGLLTAWLMQLVGWQDTCRVFSQVTIDLAFNLKQMSNLVPHN